MAGSSERPDFEATATLRVGIALGLCVILGGLILTLGATATGDPATATWLGAPTTVLGIGGTIAYATQRRRRIGQADGIPTVDGIPVPDAVIGPLQWRGEGFTTTLAFPITWGDPPQTVWITARQFPEIGTLHAHLGGPPPSDREHPLQEESGR